MTGDTETRGSQSGVFTVLQPGFEGTLGELAYALRSGGVSPSAINLLELVQAFLRHFKSLAAHDLELASIALPNVAQVIELKLRLLLPRPSASKEEGESEELDETLEAVAMMEELEDAIVFLRQRRDERRIVLPASTPRPEYPRRRGALGAGIDQLARLASRYREGAYFELSVDRLTISGAMADLLRSLRRWGRMMLHEAPERPDWPQLTVFFAGMLELVREGRVCAQQNEPYGEIELVLEQVQSAEVA